MQRNIHLRVFKTKSENDFFSRTNVGLKLFILPFIKLNFSLFLSFRENIFVSTQEGAR